MLKTLGNLFVKAIGGSRNDRLVRSYMRFVTEQVNPLEPQMQALGEADLPARAAELRDRVAGGESLDAVRAEAFALIREACFRGLGIRLYDVQLVAGAVLDAGWIAEEATGEGKTFACYPAIFMAWVQGYSSHVVTVNDPLVKRDAEFAQQVFSLLGISVGYLQNTMPAYGDESEVRRKAYACDVTYGTNSEFGFDYLRDNMKLSVEEQVQGALDFAIVDEVDSILIDEARTPLIISGRASGQTDRFGKADQVARELIRRHQPYAQAARQVEAARAELTALQGEREKKKGDAAEKIDQKIAAAEKRLDEAEAQLESCTPYYEIELDKKSVQMTHEGVSAAQEVAGVGSFYVGANMGWPHLMDQALRAHLVYERDKEYVVQDGAVVIVDEFTGRLMEGRQWSDGLHQAVEAKERVTIKEETQTMATVTIQNFFRMYRKLAGMTGTAMTEATEFMKIYSLDVVSVPTHRPVNRMDYEDRIYAGIDDKYDALVEEVNAVSKAGRPVLVGTTSVEKSEHISEMLTRRHGIAHEVLNARIENAARELDIVAYAGQQRPLKKDSKQMVGNVTIATNMAGRGTDIKLGPGVVCENCHVPPAEKLAELGLEVDPLYPPGVNKCCIHCQQYDPASNCANCFKPKLDPAFPKRGREQCPLDVPCGLHIVGTERHEARRIDNQLRGRSGRQGDPGSSRFFLSLRDDLMSIFAKDWLIKVFGWLGVQGDQAIEHKRVSKTIEKTQKKVEERNFEIRKNLLETDEVMDHQRKRFYELRQEVLAGRDLRGRILEMVDESIANNVGSYLDGGYPKRLIAEWARSNLQIAVEEGQIDAEDPADLPRLSEDLRGRAREEAGNVITVTLGEYIGEEEDRKNWDLRALCSWAQTRFGVSLTQNKLRGMNYEQIENLLTEAAMEHIDQIDLTPLGRFLQPQLAERALAEWAGMKFGVVVSSEDVAGGPAAAEAALQEKARAAYRQREIEYPVEHALEMTIAQSGPDNVYALNALADWANYKYEAGLSGEALAGRKPADIRQQLVALSAAWLDGEKLPECVDAALGGDSSAEAAAAFARQRFATDLPAEAFAEDPRQRLMDVGREFARREMTELERYVLLQTCDNAWVDHLLTMDHLRDAIGLRGFAEQDPRVAFKREGATQFQDMLDSIREKVSDLIFKVRLGAGSEMASAYNVTGMAHEQLTGLDHLTAGGGEGPAPATAEPQKIQTIVNEVPKVGRNDPCPCGSGKKYKKCCGRA